MNLKNILKARQGSHGWSKLLIMAAVFLTLSANVFAQNYTLSLTERRMGNQIGVEIWAKAASSNVPKIGNMSVSVLYNTSNLSPADPAVAPTYSLATTDSVSYDVNQASPYITITSPYNSANQYSALTAQAANSGGTYIYQLDVNMATLSASNGYSAATSGRGTFVGMLRFNIINHATLTNATLSNISLNTGSGIGALVAYDVEGNNITSTVSMAANTAQTIRGITILNPNGPNEAVNRNKTYASLGVAGYPIYFERSGLITPAVSNEYGTNVVAYGIQYSTNNGTTWSNESFRVAESRLTLADHITNGTDAALPNGGNHYSGEITTTTGTSAGYLITKGDGTQLPVVSNPGYGGVLRVIWDADEFFATRSEQAKLRITQLNTTGNTADISARGKDAGNPYDESNAAFVLSRLFFLQLDGTTGYLRTAEEYVNATQLTVSAWINLNSYNAAAGAEPGIVAVGPGPQHLTEEGAWILYLHEGKYPAFRAREQIGGTGRGENGGSYIATLISPDSLVTASDAFPINSVTGHSDNWVHLAATVNNNVVSLYVNGELVATKSNTNAPNIRMATFSHPIWVGVNPTGGLDAGDYLHAGIKEVQVWRKALTQDELRPYIMGVSTPATVAAGGARASLIHYYDFSGISSDLATHAQQNGTNVIYYFENASFATNPNSISAEAYPYRPDRAHIRLTSPQTGAGVSNLSSSVFPVRWISYGVGDATTASTADYAIEFSRDGGTSWAYAIDSQTPGQLLDGNDIENATANWKPYNSATVAGAYNDLQAVLPTETNYSKTVKLRIRGTVANSQDDISYTTGNFTVAPYFSLKNTGNSIVTIDGGTDMNLTGGSGMIEAWIRPYRRPTALEGYFPIITKKDSASNTGHYALRMLSTGQLQFTVTNTDGNVLTATSDATKPIDDPNAVEMDSAWTHVAVYVNLANGVGTSAVKFYIDGNVQNASAITEQLGANVTVNDENTYPTFLMYEPGEAAAASKSFIGEIKGLRYWNGVPANVSTSGNEPTELTNFIRGSLGVKATELLAAYKTNLIAAFDFDGGSFVSTGYATNGVYSVSQTDSLQAKIIRNNGLSYAAVEPYLKIAEPIAHQVVANTTEDLRVRWVGFNYDRNAFRVGDNTLTQDADLAYSIFGGGESDDFNFNPVSSDNDLASFTDALTLPLTSTYRFLGTNPPLNQFAGELNVSISANDGATQSPIPAVNDNARFRLLGRATVNTLAAEEYTEYDDLRNYGPLFTMTPASNFTVRTLLEGYHLGKATAFTGVLGSTFAENGLRVSLYTDNGGRPGTLVATSLSSGDFNEKDPLGTNIRGTNGSTFANVPFVFTDILDGNYFILLEHQNHLPVVSRYPARFTFSGDDYSTWLIESGWDFQGWDGTASSTIDETTAETYPVNPGTYFTAWGYSESNSSLTNYGATGLRYNDGQTGTVNSATSMAAMVAGDVIRDGKINAADRVKVRLDVAGAGSFQSDVTGDGNVNATDRQIVDRNDGIFFSVEDIFPSLYSGSTTNNNGGGAGLASPIATEWETRMNANDHKLASIKTNAPAPSAAIKDGKVQAGGLNYTVSAETEYDEVNGLVYLSMYIQNVGAEWAPANCTFAVTYNPNQLSYENIVESRNGESTIWSAHNAEFGYDVLYSAPTAAASNPLPDVRSIEIDYNNAQRLEGKNVPYTRTYIGTLAFKVRGEANEFAFKWNKLSVVHTTNGVEATKYGVWKDITPVNTVKTATFVYPNGGEVLKAGASHFITWTKPSVQSLVNIDFSHDNGNTWTRINESPINVMDLQYNWTAPMISSGECVLRMTDVESGMIVDFTDDIFSVLPAANYIVSPVSVDPVLYGGNNATIKFVVEETSTLRFEFSADGVSNWSTVATGVNSQNGQTAWVVPQNINSKNAVIAMYDAVSGQFLAKSEPFRVLSGKLTLTRPSAGEIVYANDSKKVIWTSTNVANFTLQLSIDGGATWQTVENNVNAVKASYNWTVINGVSTTTAVLRAVWNNDNDLEFSRTQLFTIDSKTDAEVDVVTELKVGQPYPNPFSLETNIEFMLPQDENVSVEVFSATGNKVASLIESQHVTAGTHTLVFNGNGLPSGTYYIKLQIGDNSILKEVVLNK